MTSTLTPQKTDTSEEIIVIGAGPAGTATAIGLVRLGYSVTLLHAPPGAVGCNGISSRTMQGLHNAGLTLGASSVAPASERRVHWNGQDSGANTEHLLLRSKFDPALLTDASNAGVRLLPGFVRNWQEQADNSLVVNYQPEGGQNHSIDCRFLVDARGRSSHGAGGANRRGPGTLSLLQQRQHSSTEPSSRVCSFEEGWAWVAILSGGEMFVQLTMDADAVQLPQRKELEQWFEHQIAAIPTLHAACRESVPLGGIIARGSTSTLQSRLVTYNSLRVGDAAMAVDPLSGNGIFQALSCALLAPAVINTILRDPSRAPLAQAFYEERVRHTFLRFARTGRDFYRMEPRWPQTGFWADRQNWPDTEEAHSEVAPSLLGIESRPVVIEGYIASREVAITSDQPLGVWHVGEIELAPLLQGLPADKTGRAQLLQKRLGAASKGNEQRKQLVTAWLRRYQLL